MSSEEAIPLQVIYNRLEPRSVSHYSAIEKSGYSVVPLESSTEQVEIPKKKASKKMSSCARFFVCMWFMFVFTAMTLTIASLLVGYYKLQGCTSSDNYNYRELMTELENVHEINFKIVTGSVLIDTHESDQLVVKLYTSARETEYLENMEANISIENGILTIKADSPSFDFETCQYNYVEVLFPNNVELQVANSVSITGHVIAGYIGTGFLSNVNVLDLTVDLGLIELEAVNANSVQAHTGLGLINAMAIWSGKTVGLSVDTGSVYASSISTPEFTAKAKYGATYNRDISADKAIAHSTFGYSTLLRPTHFTPATNQEISVSAHYGKAIASYEQFYDVAFQMGNMKGDLIVEYENECELSEQSENSLQGTCEMEYIKEATTEISVSVCYGTGLLLQNEPNFDMQDIELDFVEIDD